MRKIIIVYEEYTEICYKHICDMLGKNFDVEKLCLMQGCSKTYTDIISKSNADYICSLDMAGFQFNTLLDYPNYNMMPEKQVHIIIDEDVFPLFGDKEFALNLFIYVPDSADKWRAIYPHIPNIYPYSKFEIDKMGNVMDCEFNQQVLDKIMDEVICETEG